MSGKALYKEEKWNEDCASGGDNSIRSERLMERGVKTMGNGWVLSDGVSTVES